MRTIKIQRGLALGMLALVHSLAAGGIARGQEFTVPRYEVFEVALTSSKDYANPFLGVTVTGTFTSPTGRKLVAYGFYDGNKTWRIRLAPDGIGVWSYVTQSSDPENEGLRSREGTFRCLPASNRGFIRPSPIRPYVLSYDDSTPFFALGDTCPVTSKGLSDANRKAYLDARAGKPFNFVRTFASLTFNAWTGKPWSERISKDPDGFPWGGTPEAPDYDRLNPAYFQRYEKILGELKERGVHAEIVVYNLYEIPFKIPADWTRAREELWGRYVVSRLSADPTVLMWTVAQEFERYPDGQYRHAPTDDDWVRRMAKLIREADPHRHPVTVHPWGRTPGAKGEDDVEGGRIGARFGPGRELDVLCHQHNSYGTAIWVPDPAPGYWDGSGAGVEKAIWADRKFGKPVLNTEYGYGWSKDYPTHINNQAHGTDKCRRAAWRIFTAGGAGLAAGFIGTFMGHDHADVYFADKKESAPFVLEEMGHAKELSYLHDFVTKRIRFVEMNPAQELVNAPNLCLANPGQEYVVYAPAGGEVTLDLSHARGDFAVAWMNPRTGVFQAAGSVAGAARRTWTAPDTNDWVLHLKQSTPTARHDWQERLERAARSPESWRARREEIRQKILVSAGLWPEFERPPLQPVIFHRLERDGYTVENVHFETWPGLHLSGNLYRPLGKTGPFPAVLFAQGHGVNGRFGGGPRSEIPVGAITLARMGFVVFCYDMAGYCDFKQLAHEFGEPRWDPSRFRFATEDKDALARPSADRLWGLNLLGLQLWNSLRVMDFLVALPDVDPRRIAATGASGGGSQTFLLAAVDERVACAAPVCMVAAEFQGGCLCENAPLLRIDLNNVEITACAAPRPLLLVSATGDWTQHNLRLEAPAIQGVYESLGAEDRFRCVQFDAPHNYNRDSRETVYAWFARWLQRAPAVDRISEPPFTVEAREDLTVFSPDHPRPELAVDATALAAVLKEKIRAQLKELWPTDVASLERFRKVMTPALRHLFAARWPEAGELEARPLDSGAGKPGFHRTGLVQQGLPGILKILETPVPAHSADARRATLAVVPVAADASSLAASLADAGELVFVLSLGTHEPERISTGTSEQKKMFPATYHRTALAWQVQDILTAVAYVTGRRDVSTMRVVGLGEAGIPALFALALAPADRRVLAILDLNGINDADESAWTGPRAQPMILRVGGLRTAAILAASRGGQWVLHNTQGRLDATVLRQAVRAAQRESTLTISEAAWDVDKIRQTLR